MAFVVLLILLAGAYYTSIMSTHMFSWRSGEQGNSNRMFTRLELPKMTEEVIYSRKSDAPVAVFLGLSDSPDYPHSNEV